MRNLHRFVQLVGENADMAGKVQEIGFSDPGAIIAYAREHGFEFDERDLEEFGSQILEKSDEFSEEELEQVAGGVWPGIVVGVAGIIAGVALVGAGATLAGAGALAAAVSVL
ncbi:hypothetical protein PTH_2299 [Pelotomaculum thermopropionicum SI]|uniref:Nif11 domain-containing protein n=1 Tax=Pelotomaculum thermopropionicum (strain DSM 13744 / JCM 10971 / SI) TaxID=370438 RepID=A5CZU2_PELTS|nr:hypothetical protein PTH_2299 [Pelotomaculum thermopropionicum SI]